jgi:hypothetical protein
MAIKKLTLNGSTIVATANNGANSTITMQCLKGDIDIPLGAYNVDEDVCHNTGRDYVKSQIPTFATIEFDMWMTGDKADAELIFWREAHQNLNDFTQQNGDQTLSLAITLSDVDANVFTFNCLVIDSTINAIIEGDMHLRLTLQPTTTPVLT